LSYLIGIDTGGTFTDCVIMNEETGVMTFGKSLSTPSDLSAGVIASIENGAESLRMSLKDILEEMRLICHGSTLALDTMINSWVGWLRLGARG
jgi:N-methylhydantoinase A